jgi:hypothetical protein
VASLYPGERLPAAVSPVAALERQPTLFDWMRQYAALVVLATILGVLAGIVYERLVPGEHEAWVILVEETGEIQPRPLGPSAQAIFRSRPVWGPVMDSLDVPGSPASFLDDSVELRPIPDAPVLMVVGRAAEPERASEIAERMALSLEAALRDAGVAGFTIFGDPQAVPVATGFADPPLLAAGAAMWIGIGLALIHYRLRRPILSMGSALVVSGADDVLVVRERRARWLGVFRRMSGRPRRWREVDLLQTVLASLTPGVVLFLPGLSWRREAKARDELLSLAEASREGAEPGTGEGASAAQRAVFVCSPTTSRRELGRAALAAQKYDRPSFLVWVE